MEIWSATSSGSIVSSLATQPKHRSGCTLTPPFTFGAAVLVNGDTVADLAGTPVFTTAATPSSPVGDYPVSVSGPPA